MTNRDTIEDELKRHLAGPKNDSISKINNLEILVGKPRFLYNCGILFPQNSLRVPSNNIQDSDGPTPDSLVLETEDNIEDSIRVDNQTILNPELSYETEEDLSDYINDPDIMELNSSVGLTILVEDKAEFFIEAEASRYKALDCREIEDHLEEKKISPELNKWVSNERAKETRGKRKTVYLQSKSTLRFKSDFKNIESDYLFPKTSEFADFGLRIKVFKRKSLIKDKLLDMLTLILINDFKANTRGRPEDDNQIFFQPKITIITNNNNIKDLNQSEHKTRKNSQIDSLYSANKKYALGHSCSTNWNVNNETINVWTENLPTFELKAPAPITEEEFDMLYLSKKENKNKIIISLKKFNERYKQWIQEQEKELDRTNDFNPDDIANLEKNIKVCRETLNKMNDGVNLLENNDIALDSFLLMNEAILEQQLRYGKDLRKFNYKTRQPEENSFNVNIENKKEWGNKGKWRTFQLGFILSTLPEVVHHDYEIEKSTDLLWFPTGGGKTEAYLGLSAFTIFYYRMLHERELVDHGTGTLIIMRYTLRLLTLQQFQRACALICACEKIRKDNEKSLGSKKISIGLWIGNQHTSQRDKDDWKKWNELKNSKTKKEEEENPFTIDGCPWCSSEIVIGDGGGMKQRSAKEKRVTYHCPDKNCEFHEELPIYFTDESVYNERPDLLLATVDKFAVIPYLDQPKTLFGITTSDIPPRLIIQDELHLINHALGTNVAVFETLISELCRFKKNGSNYPSAKVIASTATISGATDQCRSLFGTKATSIFPPVGIKIEDNYFSKIDNKIQGRKYMGIFNHNETSRASTYINVMKNLLDGTRKIDDDSYWTIVSYFNTLKEKANAYTYAVSDIRGKSSNRQINPNNIVELDSRADRKEIEKILSRLTREKKTSSESIDICLSSNMISVGIDIERLNLMTIFGQCKGVAEYIQATSRVGRNSKKPGLVLVVYHPYRLRDKSYFEQFKVFHESFYRFVEPSSITPFSKPSIRKSLPSILVAYHRYCHNLKNPTEIEVEHKIDFKNFMEKRTELVDEKEKRFVLEEIERIYKVIESSPREFKYWSTSDSPTGKKREELLNCLLHPPTDKVRGDIAGNEDEFLFANQSMRDVDGQCEGYVYE